MVARLLIDASQDYGLSVAPSSFRWGYLSTRAAIGRELYQASYAFLGLFRGGLAKATILARGGFAAICGSSLATAATMSKVAIPQIRRFGYGDSLSTAPIAAGGTLGTLIPPLAIFVNFGLLGETSIGKPFIAGIVPGLNGIVFYICAVRHAIWRNPSSGLPGERTKWSYRLVALTSIRAVLLLFFLVIGGLYGVLDVWTIHIRFSPTEAAGMGAMGAIRGAILRSGWRLDFSRYRKFSRIARSSACGGSQLVAFSVDDPVLNSPNLCRAGLRV